MNRNHYLDCRDVRLDRNVYRYIPLNKLLDLFKQSQSALCHPRKWHDPFETLLLDAKFRTKNGTVHRFPYRNHIYCQCWTIESRSDALWKIYCPQLNSRSRGMRIRTTLRSLADSLSASEIDLDRERAFVGKVQYMSQDALLNRARTEFTNKRPIKNIARLLLMKRYAFKHEAEIRLIYITHKSDHRKDDGILKYSVKPHELISQIMIDPRITPRQARIVTSHIREQTSYTGEIKHSVMYKKPNDLIVDV